MTRPLPIHRVELVALLAMLMATVAFSYQRPSIDSSGFVSAPRIE